MPYTDTINRWRKLLRENHLKLRWAAIPRQVADSMAFDGEPSDLKSLQKLHPPIHPLEGVWKCCFEDGFDG